MHTGIYSDDEVLINYDKARSNFNNGIKTNTVLSKLVASSHHYSNICKTTISF